MKKSSRIRTVKGSRPGDRNRLGILTALGVLVVLAGIMMGHVALAAESPPLPPAKAQLAAQEQQAIALAQAHARPKPAAQAPAGVAAPARQAGILDMHQGPFPATQFTVRNFWQGPVGSSWVLAYAGAKRSPDGSTGPGALVLFSETANASGDFDLHYIGTYAAASDASALTITAVNGNTMQLRTDAGSTLTFDLQTLQYS